MGERRSWRARRDKTRVLQGPSVPFCDMPSFVFNNILASITHKRAVQRRHFSREFLRTGVNNGRRACGAPDGNGSLRFAAVARRGDLCPFHLIGSVSLQSTFIVPALHVYAGFPLIGASNEARIVAY
jgi:hypothetical protein